MSTTNAPRHPIENVPLELRDKKCVFGYLIDDEFQLKHHTGWLASIGVDIADFPMSESFYERTDKKSLVRNGAEEARCEISVLNVRSRKGAEETAIFVVFFANTPPYVDRHFPTADELASFKESMFLSADDDPEWHLLPAKRQQQKSPATADPSLQRPPSSSTPKHPIENVPLEFRDKKCVFGYLIDDEFQLKHHTSWLASIGVDIADFPMSESFYERTDKKSLVRNGAEEAGCEISVLNVRPRKGAKETAIIVVFFANTPPYVDRHFPTADELARFKESMFLSADDNPQWYIV